MAAIAEQPAAAETPTAKYVQRQLGPLTCRFPAADEGMTDGRGFKLIPDVETLVARANRFLPHNPYGFEKKAEYRKLLLSGKERRKAAASAVKTQHLRNAKGEPYKASELRPLVTLVSQELGKYLRSAFREQDKRDREQARAEQREEARKQRIKDRLVAKAAAQAQAAVLPEGAKPSKVVSKDQTRPQLCGVSIQRVGRGDAATWQLVATDAYQATIFPLTVHGDPGLRECTLPPEAVKAIESSGAFRFTKDGLVQAVSYSTRNEWVAEIREAVYLPHLYGESTTLFKPTEHRPFRILEGVKPSKRNPGVDVPGRAPDKRRIEIILDAQLLHQIQQAAGRGVNAVRIEVDANLLERDQAGVRRTLKPIRVTPNGHHHSNGVRAVLMPVRGNVH